MACQKWSLRAAAAVLAAWVGSSLFGLSGPAWLAADEPATLRVLTYNIHHGEGMDGQLDLPRIAEVIKRVKPDVVALQEVDVKTGRSQGVDQAAELGKLTGMHSAFGKAMEFDGGAYGGALLSRWPLEDVRVMELPKAEGAEPRCILAARIQPDGDRPAFVFAGTHLEHAKAQLCLCQAGKLGPYLADSKGLPVILAGDLNAEFDSAPLTVLRRHYAVAASESLPTFPADQPRTSLDHVLYRPTSEWQVMETQVVDEPAASDHRPLLVVLQRPS
jgi:endonuclease/exonuclease/phosphatase family metal-dependent hydrolase